MSSPKVRVKVRIKVREEGIRHPVILMLNLKILDFHFLRLSLPQKALKKSTLER
jgi:hypothetical protein